MLINRASSQLYQQLDCAWRRAYYRRECGRPGSYDLLLGGDQPGLAGRRILDGGNLLNVPYRRRAVLLGCRLESASIRERAKLGDWLVHDHWYTST